MYQIIDKICPSVSIMFISHNWLGYLYCYDTYKAHKNKIDMENMYEYIIYISYILKTIELRCALMHEELGDECLA